MTCATGMGSERGDNTEAPLGSILQSLVIVWISKIQVNAAKLMPAIRNRGISNRGISNRPTTGVSTEDLVPFMKIGHFVPFLFLLLLTGCNTGIVVHDQARAAELVVDFLSGFKSDDGVELSYAWTDDKFKEKVSADEFARIVSSIRSKNQGADISLDGFEFFGPVEAITLHASSQSSAGKIWFKFKLVGSRSKDYYLLELESGDTAFAKEAAYREYAQPIVIRGV
jgi:hypothetical protein